MLTTVSQRLHPVRDERIEFGDRDGPVAQQIGLAREPLDQRLGERAMALGGRFHGGLAPLRGGEGHDAVLGLGELVDDAIHVDRPP